MSLVEQIETTKFRYKREVVDALIRSNRARYGIVRPETRMILFLMLNGVTKWGIGYWFNVRKKMKLDLAAMEPDDVALELYDVFNGCVDVFDDQKGELLHQYQKSVTRKFRKIFNSKVSTEVGFGFINGEDYSEEEGMEMLLNKGETDTETGYEFDLDDVERVLSARQMKTLEKVLTLNGSPTAKDFGASPQVYEATLKRMTDIIEKPQRRRSMKNWIWKNREFRDIPKNELPQEGEKAVIICVFKELVADSGFKRYEVLEHRHDGEDWDFYHLGIFTEIEDAEMFADVKIRTITRR
jgi:hypothetical protein